MSDYEGKDKIYISISRLSKMWNEAKDRLDKHRRKSDQKIEVQHIHVNTNQAIVGSNMQMDGGNEKKGDNQPYEFDMRC